VKNVVQKEVMKKTRTYGLIGLLLAIMCVAMIYSYGTTPGISPESPLPQVTPSGGPNSSIPPISSNISPTNPPNPSPNTSPNTSPETSNPQNEVSPMKTFSSYEELKTFLNTSNTNNNYYTVTGESRNSLGSLPPTTAQTPTSAAQDTTGGNTKDYSTTNIQVAGVDEADTVKTDGKYLYTIGNNSQVLYVIDANPQSSRIVSRIFLNNTYLSGIYLSQDGSRLAVIGNQYVPYPYEKMPAITTDIAIYPYWNSGSTFIYVYDVSNQAKPVLASNFTMSGNYFNSRMINNYIYTIVTQNAYLVNDTVILPTVFTGTSTSTIYPSKIYYANVPDSWYSYTTFVALNIIDSAQKPSNMTIMMGGAGTMYVSQDNIYLTYPLNEWQPMKISTPTSNSPITSGSTGTASSGTSTVLPIPIMPYISQQKTSIYRIHIAGASMTFAAQGNVTGNVLNQYSMDESNGYFRIATNFYDYNSNSGASTQQNNLYVLDMSLKIVGKLENLGTGENFHAARFMGNRCYLVTFMKTDPLFVIDLSQPTSPKVLGELIIPGYSDYLHPYDETHLIGLGKDAVASTQGNFAWYQGLKLSLFDVSNVNAPKEISQYIIGDRGTDSPALSDPKAFLFDSSRGLLIIPVNLCLIANTSTSAETKPGLTTPIAISPMPGQASVPSGRIGTGSDSASTYGQFVWQGAYIFNVNLNTGFTMKGNVTQMDHAAEILANPSLLMQSSYQWMDYNHFITRTVYIGNVLYTFSETRVQLNSLENFGLIAKIELN
jgi:inhibitor of cysteine peptidase